MKRFLAFGMAACMVMGSMTACGSGKSDSGSSDAATTDSSSSDSSGDNGEVKLTMLGWEIYQRRVWKLWRLHIMKTIRMRR